MQVNQKKTEKEIYNACQPEDVMQMDLMQESIKPIFT
jgi:hypothetical protein